VLSPRRDQRWRAWSLVRRTALDVFQRAVEGAPRSHRDRYFNAKPWPGWPDPISNVRDALELLARHRLIPDEWLGPDAPVVESRGSIDDGARGVAALATLASDPVGVATAERAARALIARLVPWGMSPHARVRWNVGDVAHLREPTWRRRRPPRSLGVDAALVAAGAPVHARALDDARALRDRMTLGFELHDSLGADLHAGSLWRSAVRTGAFAALPDPIAPRLVVWQTGYAVAQVTADEVVLFAPAVEAHPQG
jgi:hypothetical protein